jgi:hypothetical protein
METHRPVTLFATILSDQWRLLTFRNPGPAIRDHWRAYLAFGLACTWLAGIGRYWDNPKAYGWQHLGVGSIVYVFVLALLLYLLIKPLRPSNWSYRNILLFTTLTALPALLYAIPVERFMSLPAAQSANAWFLGIVAAWRVSLLCVFLRRVANLSGAAMVVAVMLPLVVIVVALTALNLEHVIFNIMAGIREHERTGNDVAYQVVFAISMYSILAAPFLIIAYTWLAIRAWGRRGKEDANP